MRVPEGTHACLVYVTPNRHAVQVVLPVSGRTLRSQYEELAHLHFLVEVLDALSVCKLKKLILESIQEELSGEEQ